MRRKLFNSGLTGSKLERLHYDPDTGEWIWLDPPNHNSRLKGQRAGYVRADGYRVIRIDGVAYYASRLAFVYMTGCWPEDEVDHEDRDPSNDRWANLRDATSSQNKWNRDTGYSGHRGVYPCGENTWQVQVGGVYIGTFDDLEDAITARDSLALAWAGPFAILNSKDQGGIS